MFLELSWRLHRTAPTVAAVRRVVDQALRGVGVVEDCRYDIVLALTEACANAVEHAGTGAEYCVHVTADSQQCSIEVRDSGVGLPADRPEPAPLAATSPRGRGLSIIQACTDSLAVELVQPHGLTVRFSKKLVWEPGAAEKFTFRTT